MRGVKASVQGVILYPWSQSWPPASTARPKNNPGLYKSICRNRAREMSVSNVKLDRVQTKPRLSAHTHRNWLGHTKPYTELEVLSHISLFFSTEPHKNTLTVFTKVTLDFLFTGAGSVTLYNTL